MEPLQRLLVVVAGPAQVRRAQLAQVLQAALEARAAAARAVLV